MKFNFISSFVEVQRNFFHPAFPCKSQVGSQPLSHHQTGMAFLGSLLLFLSGCASETILLEMRDGIRLHTDVDFPPFYPADKRGPAVFERSPYGENAEELIALVFAELLGYVGIRQDMRGTGRSEGTFGIWHDSVNDTFDTLEWVTNQTWSNGEVFVTGASADAIDAVCSMSDPHPSVRAHVIVFATSQAWETFFVGGAYREALIDGWLKGTVRDQAGALIPYVHSKEAPSNPWWNTVNGTLWFQKINYPSIHWAGWYDIFQSGHLSAWEGYAKQSSLPNQAKLVIDPCGHCQAAASSFPQNAVLGRAALPLLMALDLLADDSVTNRTWPEVPEGAKNVTFYVMGADEGGAPGNYWTSLDDFPVPEPYTLYLTQEGTLSPTAPASATASLSYTYDPADPVPTDGGDNLEIPCGPLDQRKIENLKRQDVLIFTTDVLKEPLAITGGPLADIFLSTSVVDTDVVVKLIDLYPASDSDPLFDGASILVLDGISRMKWREWRRDNSENLLSGDPADLYATTVGLWNTSYIFAAGHRVRVHVTSSNYPRFLPNPNSGSSFNEQSNVTAHTTIHLSAAHPSSLTLPMVSLSDVRFGNFLIFCPPPNPQPPRLPASLTFICSTHAPRHTKHFPLTSQLPKFPVEEAVAALEARLAHRWDALGEEERGGHKSIVSWLGAKMDKVRGGMWPRGA